MARDLSIDRKSSRGDLRKGDLETIDMKIDRVDIFAVRIPYVRPIIFAYGARTIGDYLVLKIYTDDGVYGIGSGGTLWPPVSGENIRGAIQLMEESFIPNVLIGENPFNINKIVDAMDRLCVGQTMSKSSVDFALHDLMGRVYGVPIYQLLGGAQREVIPQEWIVLLDTPEKMAETAKLFVDAGYAGIKFKWSGDVDLDIARTRLIRQTIGDKIELCVDVNQAYTADLAIKVINATESSNLKFIEEPVHRDDFDGFIKVRQHTNAALAADESAWTLKDAVRFLKFNLVDYLHAAPSRIGGFVKLRRYVEMAQAHFVTCIYSIYNSPALEYACSAHWSFAARPKKFADEIVGIFNVHGGVGTDDIKEGITDRINPPLRNGKLYKPEGPGLGMELNMDFVRKYLLYSNSVAAN
jgi:L-Ala-D/L-Glu epimerase / N-acetyl-D-glutamate racemase